MPWFSGKKKTTTDDDEQHDHRPDLRRKSTTATASAASSPQTSPEKRGSKKSHSSSVREREKAASGSKERPKSPRHSKSFGRGGDRLSRKTSEEHPLNLHPDELRRLSKRMSVPSSPGPSPAQENGTPVEPMETTPAPESVPGGFPTTNGVNGAGSSGEEEQAPAPPPHKSPRTPPPQKEPVDAEACKAAGNKFYKAGQYEKAIAEYTKGMSDRPRHSMLVSQMLI